MTTPRTIHLGYIDGLRAIAVLAVVTYHSFAMPTWLPSGMRGVELFFVLSGFCLAFPFLQKHRATGTLALDYRAFLVRRFVRIAPPYYVALALFGVLGATSFGYPTATHAAAPIAIVREFLGDFAFAIPLNPMHNAAFWTLAVEARWYLVCPILIALYVRSKIGFAALGLAFYASWMTVARGLDLGILSCFMLGIVAADLALRDLKITRAAWLGAVAALVVATMQQATGAAYGDFIWHLAAFLIVVAASAPAPSRALAARPLVAIGTASYSVYLVHDPLITWLRHAGVASPIAAAVGIAAGFGFYALVERPAIGARFRKPLEARLRGTLRLSPAV